jgi:hypothetical protein
LASAYSSKPGSSNEEALKVGQNSEDFEEAQHNWGRLVIHPEEAKIEFGEERAAKLKKTADGKMVLWPQPDVSSSNVRSMWSGQPKLGLTTPKTL